MTRRRVLITGAGGFVGAAMTTGFSELGWQVTALDRAFEPGWKDPAIDWVQADLAYGVPTELPDADLVVHAAWITTDPKTMGITDAEYVALNARPFDAIVDYVSTAKPSAFVFLSSSGVFSPTDATDGLVDTHTPTGTSPYATAKRSSELMVGMEARVGDFDARTSAHVLRLGYLFGPGERARPSRTSVSLVAEWISAAQEGRPMEVRSDTPRRDWTFAPDLAAAIERIVDGAPAERPIHLASPHVLDDGALSSIIADHFPGAETAVVSPPAPAKPPMVPSDVPALHGFDWTDPISGIRAIVAAEAAA